MFVQGWQMAHDRALQPTGYFGQSLAKAKHEVYNLNQHFEEKSFPKML